MIAATNLVWPRRFWKLIFTTPIFLWSKIFDIRFTTKKIGVFLHINFEKRCVRQNAFVQSFRTSGTKLHKLHWREVRSANQSTKRRKTGKDLRFRCVPIGAEIFKIVRDIKGRAFMLYFKKWSSLRFVANSQKIVWHRTLSVTASILQILIKSDLIEWSNSSGRRFEE